MNQIYTVADFIRRKEVINPKYIERLLFSDVGETKMMGDYSRTYYDEKYTVSIHLFSGAVIVLNFKKEKEALAEYALLSNMMVQQKGNKMKKPIAELQNEQSKYYDEVNVWFDGGEREDKREHYAFETTAVRANKEGKKYIEITDLYRGIYTFGKEKTIHNYNPPLC